MPDWVVWIAVGWLVFAVTAPRRARAGGCGARRRRLHGSCARPRYPAGRARRRGLSEGSRSSLRSPAPAPVADRRPLTTSEREARLRKQYVSGRITVEEYEAGLDRLYRRE